MSGWGYFVSNYLETLGYVLNLVVLCRVLYELPFKYDQSNK